MKARAMIRLFITCGVTLGLTVSTAAQTPQVPAPITTDVLAQPATWVPFQSVVEHNGVAAGRFWRDAQGSTRLELDAPDSRGRVICIENIPQATYYVFRPASGWTAQPMWLPTTGWQPRPVARVEAGTVVVEDGWSAYERLRGPTRERRAPALNFFAVTREQPDGTVERHRQIVVGDVPADLFAPPSGATVTVLTQPGGIVARPAPRGGAQ
jgi:hypothetical protein